MTWVFLLAQWLKAFAIRQLWVGSHRTGFWIWSWKSALGQGIGRGYCWGSLNRCGSACWAQFLCWRAGRGGREGRLVWADCIEERWFRFGLEWRVWWFGRSVCVLAWSRLFWRRQREERKCRWIGSSTEVGWCIWRERICQWCQLCIGRLAPKLIRFDW